MLNKLGYIKHVNSNHNNNNKFQNTNLSQFKLNRKSDILKDNNINRNSNINHKLPNTMQLIAMKL